MKYLNMLWKKTGNSLKFVEKPLDNTINTLLKQYYEVVDNNEASYPKDKIEFENITNHLENVWKSACIWPTLFVFPKIMHACWSDARCSGNK